MTTFKINGTIEVYNESDIEHVNDLFEKFLLDNVFSFKGELTKNNEITD